MSALSQFAVYDGRRFMGSVAEDAAGKLNARGQDYRSIGKFRSRREAIAAIVARYRPPECDAAHQNASLA